MGTPEDVAAENYFTPPEEVKSKMRVSKAIECLTAYMEGPNQADTVEFSDAVKLGTSALRQIQRLRLCNYGPAMDTLVGETEE